MAHPDRLKLSSVTIRGFKSFDAKENTICFGDNTVLLGANGAGKSNVVSFFRMVNYMMTEALETYIGDNGFASSVLHFGPKNTNRLGATIVFESEGVTDKYDFVLSFASGDSLIFTEESLSYHTKTSKAPLQITFDIGMKEARLPSSTKSSKDVTKKVVYAMLRNCAAFQFHDTSPQSGFRRFGYINDNSYLKSDGGNLAAFLFAMKQTEDGQRHYDRIIRHIRQAFPQFGDFVLQPSARNESYIGLDWNESGSDHLFGAHQLSDGTIRFMALTTLLLQPPRSLPSVIVIDEPELGLHPAAISELVGMVKQATRNCQVVLATQSPRLVDEFDPENIVVVERNQQTGSSEFKHFESEKLEKWLADYTMGELWEKNVIGGKP